MKKEYRNEALVGKGIRRHGIHVGSHTMELLLVGRSFAALRFVPFSFHDDSF